MSISSGRSSGLFIAGTDTGVGKTLVTASLLKVLADLGVRAAGMKPVAAGADLVDGRWVNEDVLQLMAQASVTAPMELVNPYLFREPVAPHLAAERKGVAIRIPRIVEDYESLASLARVVLVEGVGGVRVPLDAQRDSADLAVALGLPIVLVVGLRLGCLNHALLSVEALQARGLRLAAWVASRVDPHMALQDENVAALVARIPAPLLADLPHLRPASPDAAARLIPVKRFLDVLPNPDGLLLSP